MDINFKSYPGGGFRHFSKNKEYLNTLRKIERVLKSSLLYLIPHEIYTVDVLKPHWGIFEWAEVSRFENGSCGSIDALGKAHELERRMKAWECCRSSYADLVSKNEIFSYVVICSVDDSGEKEIIHVLASEDMWSRQCYTNQRRLL